MGFVVYYVYVLLGFLCYFDIDGLNVGDYVDGILYLVWYFVSYRVFRGG